MRHLALNIEIENSIRSPHGIIELQDAMRKSIGEKFDGFIYISVHYFSSHVPMSAFDLTGIFRDLSDFICYSEEQVKKVKVKTTPDCREFFIIDVFELEQ